LIIETISLFSIPTPAAKEKVCDLLCTKGKIYHFFVDLGNREEIGPDRHFVGQRNAEISTVDPAIG